MTQQSSWSKQARIAAVAAITGGVLMAGIPAEAAPAAHSSAGQSATSRAGVNHLGQVVARTDVDGDGTRDRVRYRVLGPKKVHVLVALSTGNKIARVLHTDGWPGGDFLGAVPLDGRAGAELVVGTILGAHTPWYAVLTLRGDRLVYEHNPAASYREWVVDAYANGYVGWTRTERNGQVHVVYRDVFRVGTSNRWSGTVRHFLWTGHGWAKAGTAKIHLTGDRRAARIGGWHVAGLPRWS
jgi:hypothetical protein